MQKQKILLHLLFMNKRKAILLQRLAAGFFLALFLFIHVAKAAHQHESVPSFAKYVAGSIKVSQTSDCSICEYQLTKDSFHFHEFPQVNVIKQILSSYSFYHTSFVTSIGSTSSGRGPPAFS